MSATESNAGDDYHFWWAAERAIELLRPRAQLKSLGVETADAELDDETDQIVDVSECFGGAGVSAAKHIVISQLKYSTRNPDKAWTLARLTPPSSRNPAPDASTQTRPRRTEKSIVGALAAAHRDIRRQCRPEATISLRLVSNQPADSALLAALAAAQEIIATDASWDPGSSEGLEQMSSEHRGTVLALVTASAQTGEDLRSFLATLDLSGCGGTDRARLHHAVSRKMFDNVGEGAREAILQLVDLVRTEAMPDARGVIDKERVLTRLGFGDDDDFLPAQERLEEVTAPVETAGASRLATLVSSPDYSKIWLHGPPGAGKTQTLARLREHLPPGSVTVLYDCFGGGSYLDTGMERHTDDAFIRQVSNSLALDCGSSMLLGPDQRDRGWRHLLRRLKQARELLPTGAQLVIVVDAADNARHAAQRRATGSFLEGLRSLIPPDGVTLVVSTQTARGLPDFSFDAELQIDGYDLQASANYLRQFYDTADDSAARRFHDATHRNPRVQRYALQTARAKSLSLEEALLESRLTPEAMFKMILDTAGHGCSAVADARRLQCLLMTSQRPLRHKDLREVARSIPDSEIDAFLFGLSPGVRLEDGLVLFSDEHFEGFLSDDMSAQDPAQRAIALRDWGGHYLARCEDDLFSAESVANALREAEMHRELIDLARTSKASIVSDAVRRRQLLSERYRLAIGAASDASDIASGLELAVRAAATSGSDAAIDELLFTARALGARYGDPAYLKSHLARLGNDDALTAYHCLMSRVAMLAGKSVVAATHVEFVRQHGTSSPDPELISTHEMASVIDTVWVLEGVTPAIDLLSTWVPTRVRAEVLGRLVRMRVDISGDEVFAELTGCTHQALLPFGARAAAAAGVATVNRARLGDWIARGLVASLTPSNSPQPVADPLSTRGYTPYQNFHEPPRGVPSQDADDQRNRDPWAPGAALTQAVTDALVACCDGSDAARLSWEDPRSDGFMQIPATDRTLAGLLPYTLSKYESFDEPMVRRLVRLADEALACGEDLQRYLEPVERGADDDTIDGPTDHLRDELGPLVRLCDLRSAAVWGDATDAEALYDHVMTTVETQEQSANERRWYRPDERYRTWASVAFDGLLRAGYAPEVGLGLSAAAGAVDRAAAADLSMDLARIAFEFDRAYVDPSIALVQQGLIQAAVVGQGAWRQAELRCRSALMIADLRPAVAAAWYEDAIGLVLAAPEDEASEASTLAKLATASWGHLREAERRAYADDLVERLDRLPDLEMTSINWANLFFALGALDMHAALAAASRWNDGSEIPFDVTLPRLLAGAAGTPQLTRTAALAMLDTIPAPLMRIETGIEIADAEGASRDLRRELLNQLRNWVPRHTPSVDIARLEGLLDAASQRWGLSRTPTHRPAGSSRAAVSGADRAEETVLGPLTLVVGGHAKWEHLGLDDPVDGGSSHAWNSRPSNRREILKQRLDTVPTALRVAALDAVLDGLRTKASSVFFVPDVVAHFAQEWRTPDVRVWLTDHVAEVVQLAMPALVDLPDGAIHSLAALGMREQVLVGVMSFIGRTGTDLRGRSLSAAAELLVSLCDADACAAALRGAAPLATTAEPQITRTPTTALAHFAYSLFGHPARATRWRAAHAVRALAQVPETAAVVGELVALATGEARFDTRYRSDELFFFDMSAQMWALVAIERVAGESPELVRPHLDRLVARASGLDIEHAAVRELARRSALKVDPLLDLGFANRPRVCGSTRRHVPISDRRPRGAKRYDFDQTDTIPYWFGHLARVFGVDVEEVAQVAEEFVVDRWDFDKSTWWTDPRELRSERAFGATMHRQGTVPPIESVSRYIDYHAMLFVAGAMVDRGIPIQIETYSDADPDPWLTWLASHLPGSPDAWLADLADPRPVLRSARHDLRVSDLTLDDFAAVVGLGGGQLDAEVQVYASRDFYLPGGPDGHVWVASALVSPKGVSALQQALESSTNPSDWKLPFEGEEEFEFDRYGYKMIGWLDDQDRGDYPGLDTFDPQAVSLRWGTHLPGTRFRELTGSRLAASGRFVCQAEKAVARASQWGDLNSSEVATWVDSEALVDFLRAVGMDLIIEVQIALDEDASGPYRAKARIFHVDQDGNLHTTEPITGGRP